MRSLSKQPNQWNSLAVLLGVVLAAVTIVPHARAGHRCDGDADGDGSVKIKEQQLVVEWNDGKRSEYPLAELRAQCPCATCRTDREKAQKNPLRVLRADPTDVRVTTAKLVGNYAIQFFWSDGHNTGIFEFRYLRSLRA